MGDIHGRLDLFTPLLRDITHDARATQPTERPVLVLLGDYVDRGAASAGVINKIIMLMREAAFEVRVLKGNHEEALLHFLDEPSFGPAWMDHGGGPTLASYGVAPPAERDDQIGWTRTRDAFALALPGAHRFLFDRLELMATVGDYAFVHAGVRPGVALDAQEPKDLLWIRGEFMQASGPFEKVIVHGHTPQEEPQLTRHRLSVDTGAYATGVLTAVRLDEMGPLIMQARAAKSRAA